MRAPLLGLPLAALALASFATFGSLGCSTPPPLTVITSEADLPAVEAFFRYTPGLDGLALSAEKNPEKALPSRGLRIAVGAPPESGEEAIGMISAEPDAVLVRI